MIRLFRHLAYESSHHQYTHDPDTDRCTPPGTTPTTTDPDDTTTPAVRAARDREATWSVLRRAPAPSLAARIRRGGSS